MISVNKFKQVLTMSKTSDQALKFYSPEDSIIEYFDVIEPRVYIAANFIGKGKKVLDVGCYDGTYSHIFLKQKNEVHGLDIHPETVKLAIQNGILSKVGNAEEKLPFLDSEFDAIYAGEIIEHLYETDLFVSELHRILKKNGILVISTPNVVSLPRRFFHLFGKAPFFEASNSYANNAKAVGHIRFFDKKLLKSFVESKGFKMTEFTSDYVNLPLKIKSQKFARLIPTFGRSLIMAFEKK